MSATETPAAAIEKIKCACGSEILPKNMSQHSKTKKHMAALGINPDQGKPCPPENLALSQPHQESKPRAQKLDNIPEDEEVEEEDDLDIINDKLDVIGEVLETLIKQIKAIEAKLPAQQ
jgi:hypothetical protein